MLVLKRILLVLITLLLPPLLTWASYRAALFVLQVTHRVIDPEMMRLATAGEFVLFFFIAVLEARERWTAHSSS